MDIEALTKLAEKRLAENWDLLEVELEDKNAGVRVKVVRQVAQPQASFGTWSTPVESGYQQG